MIDFPVILENSMSHGISDGRKVSSSILNAASTVLICRGANKIIIPTPGEGVYKMAIEGIENIPKERRDCLKIVDRKSHLLNRVRNYLAPLKEQAIKWPEDAYVKFLEDFLYHLSIATKYKAGIAHDEIGELRGFIPIIDPLSFKGEARYRLAETINLVCSYKPQNPLQGLLKTEVSCKGISGILWDIIETAEFKSIVAESGKLGYIKNPKIGLRKVQRLFTDLLKLPHAKPILRLAHTSAELSGTGIPIDIIEQIINTGVQKDEEGRCYSAPFIDLGPAILSISSIALLERYPNAIPPEGKIMLLETCREGVTSYSWLNVEEVNKLKVKGQNGYKDSLRMYERCIETQNRFYK